VLQKRKAAVKGRWLETIPFGPTLVASLAEKSVLAKTQGHYPAPLTAIQSVLWGLKRPLSVGLENEAQLFSKLVPTDISKNLTTLFFIQEDLKKYTGVSSDIRPKSITNAGVVGAGLMGGGIARLLSSKSIPVRIKDINWDAIKLAYQAASKVFQKLVQVRKLKKNEADLGMQAISATTDYRGFMSTDIVVEAIVENMELKKKVFAELESAVRSDTIIVSNTSALSITEMATALQYPDRFAGMHFFSPVNRMPLVEVIPGEHTSPETIASVVQLAKTLKKTPIVVKNCPGFLINRILIPYVNEAVFLLQDGASILEIDRVMESFGMPMGPLALADEVGLDVGYKVAKILEQGYGERMTVASIFDQLHRNDALKGKKTGKGFYLHSGNGKQPNPEVMALLKTPSGKTISGADILDRLILIMVNEAARCIDESVIEKPDYLDMGMVMGTGFPPFRLGLCRYADQRGISEIVARLDELAKSVSSRFVPADKLVQMAQTGERFYSNNEKKEH